MGTNFNPPNLVLIPSKGNKWFVVVTKSKELQAYSKNKQVRRSTGADDERITKSKSIQIVNEIYQKFEDQIDEIYRRANARAVDPSKVFISDAFMIQQLGLDKDPS